MTEANGATKTTSEGLRLVSLAMENIGPFDKAEIEFATGTDGKPPVTIFTGENGTGKTIVLDAIRGMFGPEIAQLERNIPREGAPFRIQLDFEGDGKFAIQSLRHFTTAALFETEWSALPPWEMSFTTLAQQISLGEQPGRHWVLDYWRSVLATDSFEIKALRAPKYRDYLLRALQGTYSNQDITALLCHFDYVRDSRDPEERASGEAAYEAATRIFKASLLEDGELAFIRRNELTPIIKQAGQTVPISSISSGNAYLVQNLIKLLGKMFSVHVLGKTDPATLCETPGILLIDEAENHLHPRWQKRFLRNVRDIFPNIQIIATTHSPFIVSSIPDARVYVCRYDRDRKTCTITDESADYANRSIEQILVSDAFDGTGPFNDEVTKLLEERDRAIDADDETTRERVERELLARNPVRFRYFEIDKMVASIKQGGA